jgi:hypothetical protein
VYICPPQYDSRLFDTKIRTMVYGGMCVDTEVDPMNCGAVGSAELIIGCAVAK